MSLGSIVPPGIVDPELGALLCSQFNLHQISLHPLRRDGQGAGYQAASIPILRTERIDFHPVDVLLDSDASILIVDTGGWYDLCCPSSGTDQRVADGGIYRLKGLTNECRSLAEHQRLVPHAVAFGALADQAQKTIEEESHGNTGWNKRRMLTDLSDSFARLGLNPPDEAKTRLEGIVGRGVIDRDESVSLLAMHLAALHRLDGIRDLALSMLKDSSAVKRRGGAEWLGRVGIDTELPIVLEVLREGRGDRTLQHSLLYALIEGGKPQALESAWESNAQQVSEGFAESSEAFADIVALLRVLDGRGKLDATHVRSLWWCALSPNVEIADFGFDAIERHPQWLPELLENIKAWESSSIGESAETKELNSQQVNAISRLIARWSDKPEVVEWVTQRFRSPVESSQKSFDLSLGILDSMRSRAMPTQWVLPVSQWLGSSSSQVQSRLRDTLRGAQWKGDSKEFSQVVLTIVDQLANRQGDDRTEIEKDIERLQWLALIPKGTEIPDDCEALVLRAALKETAPGEQNESEVQRQVQRYALGWEILPSLRLVRPESRTVLLLGLPQLGVLQLPKVMEAYLRGANDSQEDQLIEAMDPLAASKSLSMDGTVALMGSLGRQSQEKWKESFLKWQQPQEDVRAGVDQWMAKLQPGDARRGYQVFRSSKATCSACHQVGYVGGKVGPVLSRIGQSRSRRELLEAILYPSARLEQAYQGIKVRTVEGDVVQGLVVSETANELELQVSADVRRRISKGEIEARETSTVSIMPVGLENQLSIEELSDLIAFLENAK
jgi:putative heme-binding domain-containing protein